MREKQNELRPRLFNRRTHALAALALVYAGWRFHDAGSVRLFWRQYTDIGETATNVAWTAAVGFGLKAVVGNAASTRIRATAFRAVLLGGGLAANAYGESTQVRDHVTRVIPAADALDDPHLVSHGGSWPDLIAGDATAVVFAAGELLRRRASQHEVTSTHDTTVQ